MVIGENGLINKAQSSVDKYKESAENEQALLNEIENYMHNYPHNLVADADGSWSDAKQVNKPKWSQGMIPIVLNCSCLAMVVIK